jgi:hypothetical protein
MSMYLVSLFTLVDVQQERLVEKKQVEDMQKAVFAMIWSLPSFTMMYNVLDAVTLQIKTKDAEQEPEADEDESMD